MDLSPPPEIKTKRYQNCELQQISDGNYEKTQGLSGACINRTSGRRNGDQVAGDQHSAGKKATENAQALVEANTFGRYQRCLDDKQHDPRSKQRSVKMK